MTSQTETNIEQEGLILPPSHQLPLFIIISGVMLYPLPFHPWGTIIVSSFGLFLLLQSFTLKILFTKDDLVVLQLGKELRRFPFKNWISWRILSPRLPFLFYFREEASPHLLPILFSVKILEAQLKEKVGDLEIRKSIESSKGNN